MIFEETKLKGAFLIKPHRFEDDRGFFSRTFCENEFAEYGLNGKVVQTAISYNKKKGTFRGMHFQEAPFEEDKMVICSHGAMLDYIVDLRPWSETFHKSIQVELSEENGVMLYVPKSFAHGFFTLQDSSQVNYYLTQFHHPECASGFRYNDPAINIHFPFKISSISERDGSYPDLIIGSTNNHFNYELNSHRQ